MTDDGCRLDHGDFNGPDKFSGWGYFKGRRLITDRDVDAEPGLMYQAGSNHGTSCAGVIAGEVDGALTVGAAPTCRLLPIKWESTGAFLAISGSKLKTALDYLADKIDVMSNSWGSTPTTFWPSVVTDRIAELGRNGGRRGRGIVFLWAAGNENCPIQHSADVDVPFSNGWQQAADGSWSWAGVRTARLFSNNLVGLPGVVHVAALASTARRSHYSNYGSGIGFCAPSSNSHAYFRMRVPGLGITTATGETGGVTESFGGTSSATPLAAGVAALAISANAELTGAEVISLLKRTASKDLDPDGYARTPAASYDPQPDWDVSPVAPFDSGAFEELDLADGTWSPWFGHGRIDAAATVAEALSGRGGGVVEGGFSSAPELAIPDNEPGGVSDVIEVSAAGQIDGIRVSVDITHTYIGDLKVSLSGPNGATVVLHDRAGARTRNLAVSYDATTTPVLAGFLGQDAAGAWTLRVEDLARRDTGQLNRWGLELARSAAPVAAEDVAGAAIPDKDPQGITRTLTLPGHPEIREVEVSLDITHPFIGDLRVTLTPPAGSPLLLHDRSGRGRDNIVEIWHSRERADLAALRGQDGGGTWRLQVADHAGRDEGKLNRWAVKVGT